MDQHACPIVSITGPDGMGMVMMGSPTVMIDFMMACRMGDIVVEIPGLAMGPMNPIIMGCPTVMIGEVGIPPPPGAVGMGGVAAGLAVSGASQAQASAQASSPPGTGSGTSNAPSSAVSQQSGAVKPFEAGTFKDLKARSQPGDGLDIDHQPSKAAQIRAAEKAFGRKLTPAEKKEIIDNGPAVAVPEAVHRVGPTYGGKNTAKQIEADSKDLAGAARRDSSAMVKFASPDKKEEARKAADWINRQSVGSVP
jgi:hypothetical protein